MDLTSKLSDRANELLLDGKWIAGTNIKSQIVDLDWKQAITKIDTLNTIADLIFHINYYLAGLADVLDGGQLVIKDKYSFDAPQIKSDQDWKDRIDKFCFDSERFVDLLKNMSEEDLLQPFVKEEYGTYLRNIDAILEHSYYHFGQIVLIKKMLENKR